jgi:hypothetical protein
MKGVITMPRLTKNAKTILESDVKLSSARGKLTDSIICLPNIEGKFGDAGHSIKCAEAAIVEIQNAIEIMKKIKEN